LRIKEARSGLRQNFTGVAGRKDREREIGQPSRDPLRPVVISQDGSCTHAPGIVRKLRPVDIYPWQAGKEVPNLGLTAIDRKPRYAQVRQLSGHLCQTQSCQCLALHFVRPLTKQPLPSASRRLGAPLSTRHPAAVSLDDS